MILFLPWPPSVNTYWRHPTKGKLAGRHLISAAGRTYRKAVIAAVLEQLKTFPKPMLGELSVYIWVSPPDRRKRDMDNLIKAVFDSCTHAGVWRDDSQIVRFTVEKDNNGFPAYIPDKGPTVVMSQGSIAVRVESLVK